MMWLCFFITCISGSLYNHHKQPAILKGWLDRVMSHGFAYRMTETGMMEGLLKGKKAIVFTTSGADKENMDKNGITDAINTCMIKGTLGFSGH